MLMDIIIIIYLNKQYIKYFVSYLNANCNAFFYFGHPRFVVTIQVVMVGRRTLPDAASVTYSNFNREAVGNMNITFSICRATGGTLSRRDYLLG